MVLAYPYQDPLVLLLEHLGCNQELLVLVHLVLPLMDQLDRLGIVALVRLELACHLGQLERSYRS